jgi:hypothetical protein
MILNLLFDNILLCFFILVIGLFIKVIDRLFFICGKVVYGGLKRI